ncbi:MAG: hypothetical protein ACRDTF_00475 [Pseudonocardiaceae bacterium]
MTDHHPASERRLPDRIRILRCVTLPAIPAVYALDHPEHGITDWVFALPGGRAIIVPSDEVDTSTIHTSLDMAATFWAELDGADLVLVAA